MEGKCSRGENCIARLLDESHEKNMDHNVTIKGDPKCSQAVECEIYKKVMSHFRESASTSTLQKRDFLHVYVYGHSPTQDAVHRGRLSPRSQRSSPRDKSVPPLDINQVERSNSVSMSPSRRRSHEPTPTKSSPTALTKSSPTALKVYDKGTASYFQQEIDRINGEIASLKTKVDELRSKIQSE